MEISERAQEQVQLLQAEGSLGGEFPAPGRSHPILCFLEIQTKGCFSIVLKKK